MKIGRGIWKIGFPDLTFAHSSLISLIQKGRGYWPDEALATNSAPCGKKVLIPAPDMGKDKLAEIFL